MHETFLCIGNFTLDLGPAGETPGGSVFYSGATAHALGADVRIVAAAGPDFPADSLQSIFPHALHALPAEHTTTMRNTYTPAGRIQHLYHAGRPLTPDDLPQTWCRDALVLLCPVFQEVTAPLARLARGRLTAASLQGWLREPDPEGRIRLHNDTSFLTALAGIDVLFYSDEDVAHDRSMATRFSQAAPIVLETRGPDGAILWNRQQRTLIPGYRVHETDPTGAGDTFAAAFLLGLDRIRSPELAAEFACKMAAIEVSNPGPLTTDLIARTHGEP